MKTGPLLVGLGLSLIARQAQARCGQVMLTIERSSSTSTCTLGGGVRGAVILDALSEVLASFPTLPMGLVEFPDASAGCTATGCAPGRVIFDIASSSSERIRKRFLEAAGGCGGAPYGSTLEGLKTYDGWLPDSDRHVVLVVDGMPDCDPSEFKRALKAVEELRTSGILTAVVVLAGKPTGVCMEEPLDPGLLDALGAAGGLPNPGGKPAFYPASDRASLGEALKKVFGKIGGGTLGGCAVRPEDSVPEPTGSTPDGSAPSLDAGEAQPPGGPGLASRGGCTCETATQTSEPIGAVAAAAGVALIRRRASARQRKEPARFTI